jgi:hypothetical protein
MTRTRALGVERCAVLAVAFAPLLGAACGGRGDDAGASEAGGADSGGTDALATIPDAGPFDAWTPGSLGADAGPSLYGAGPEDFGPAVWLDSMAIGTPGVGTDFTGDGVPDDEFGTAPAGIPEINNAIADAIANSGLTLTLELRALEDPSLAGPDPSVGIAVFTALAAPVPGEYLVRPESLDADGRAVNVLSGSLTVARDPGHARHVHASTDVMQRFLLGLDLLLGTIDGDLVAHGDRIVELRNAWVGGVLQACNLAAIADPFTGSGSLLDLLLAFGVEPDVDLSGDGLETFQLGPGLAAPLLSCTDGDGTVIPNLPNRPCACDERIEDGVSMAISVHGLGARLVGVQI